MGYIVKGDAIGIFSAAIGFLSRVQLGRRNL